MRSTWQPSDRTLRNFARTHFRYEVWTLTGQTAALIQIYPHGIQDPKGDALLEASLIHLRLLDDFLGSSRQIQAPTAYDDPDVFARHWLPTWRPKRFLTPAQRKRANTQLAHLSGRRYWRFTWNPPGMTTACCWALLDFFDALEREQPTRARWFSNSRALAENWLRITGQL